MIVVDIEASGTEPHIHSIVSIGAIDFNNPTNRFYEECRMWSGAKIMDGALKVNGFTEAEITDPNKQEEAVAVGRFIDWTDGCSDRTFCGQNPSFDREFLRTAAGRAHFDWPFAYRTIDTHSLCWMHIIKSGEVPPVDLEKKHSRLSLDAILNYCGIKDEPHPHNALTGALCHAEVASRLLYDKKLLPEFEQYAIPWLSQNNHC